jgi:hypothetical protein
MIEGSHKVGIPVAAAAGMLFSTAALAESNSQLGDATMFTFIVLVLIAIYVFPTIVAFARSHPNRWVILLINCVFGTTVIGWLGALIWAFNAVHKSPIGMNGGESGLNLFVNDEKRIRIVSTETIGDALGDRASHGQPIMNADYSGHNPKAASVDPSSEFKRLKQLFEANVINEAEFARMKAQLVESYVFKR